MSDTVFTFQIERWRDCHEELEPLWQAYADEAKVTVDPDNKTYSWVDDVGDLVLATMRADGVLVGILRFILGPDLHQGGELYAVSDGWFILPAWRGGHRALRLMRECEAELRKRGIRSICQSSGPFRPIDKLLERSGWTRGETLYRKRL